MLLELVMGLIFWGIYIFIDALITRKKVKRNQLLWDEYSKDMTYYEKMECFLEWLHDNKAKHGDNFYYIPRI
jgi:hypothetical protein